MKRDNDKIYLSDEMGREKQKTFYTKRQIY